MKKQIKKKRVIKKENPRGLHNRIAMISITFVVMILFGTLLLEGASLKQKVTGYEEKKVAISKDIKQEEARTKEIDELKTYMASEEYAQEVARNKLGLVKDNEIVFKEEK